MTSIKHPNVRRWLVALWLVVAASTAQADDPVNGAALYARDCRGCHGANPITSNSSKIFNGRNARAVTDAAITNVADMNSLRGAYPAGGSALADIAAYLGNTPTTLSFGSAAVGSTSGAQTFTVYASLKAGNAIGGLTVATSGDFARAGGSCSTTVATGQSCTVTVTFTPTAAGARSGTLSVSHNNTLAPIAIPLSGTGTASAPPPAPVAGLAPSSLAFGSTAIGATSAAQNATLSNTGNAALVVSSIASSDPANFTIAGGTCSAGGSVAAGSSCTVAIAFAPTGATGARNASLSIGHNAAGSPGTVALSGSATPAAAPSAAITASLGFGSVNVATSSGVQTATLSNAGNAPLVIGTLATGSAEFAVSGGSCRAGGSVAAGGSCTVDIAFTPSTAGARSATLSVTHNAGGSPSTTSLSGTGVALTPAIGVSPTALGFTQTAGSTSAPQTIVVGNSGNANLTLAGLAIGGAQAGEFAVASGSTCTAGGTVAPNASCVVKIAFTPGAAGARSASLSITHNAAGSPTTVSLGGTGTATPQPAISLNTTTLTFMPQTIGSASAAQSVTVTNSGSATLTLGALATNGSAAAEFARGGTCAPAATLTAGASCLIAYTFTPTALGSRTATLTIASDAVNGSAALALAGTGAAVPTPAVTLAPSTLAFGNQTVGVASTARNVTLTNSGSGALAIAGITASTGFGATHNCGASLSAAASCTVAVVFTPSAAGNATGSVSIASNAVGSPHAVALSGSGVVASPVLAWSPAVTQLAFGDATVGAAPASRTLTLTNQGPGSVALQQFTLAGAQAADFSIAAGSTCALGGSVPAAGSCTLALAFQPGAAGARVAELQVTSSGTNPPNVPLAGNGTALAAASVGLSPTALAFTVDGSASAAAPQTLTLQNTGGTVLHVSAARVAAGSFTMTAAATAGCAALPFDLMPGQGCGFTVGWSGAAVGSEAGSVEITTSAAPQPVVVALQATRNAVASSAAPAALSNAGGGGCSLARGASPFDPVLAVLAVLAGAVLWRRRAPRHSKAHRQHRPAEPFALNISDQCIREPS